MVDEAVEAGCEQNGWTEGSHCENCGYVEVAQQYIPPKNHQYPDGSEAAVILERVEPTCELAGHSEGKKCELCGKIYWGYEPLEPTGHHYVPATDENGEAGVWELRVREDGTEYFNRVYECTNAWHDAGTVVPELETLAVIDDMKLLVDGIDSLTYTAKEQSFKQLYDNYNVLCMEEPVNSDTKTADGRTLTATATDAGKYRTTINLKPNYCFKTSNTTFATSVDLDWEITKANLTVTASDNAITYGQAAAIRADNSLDFIGFLGNDRDKFISSNKTESEAVVNTSNAGYTITAQTGNTSENVIGKIVDAGAYDINVTGIESNNYSGMFYAYFDISSNDCTKMQLIPF